VILEIQIVEFGNFLLLIASLSIFLLQTLGLSTGRLYVPVCKIICEGESDLIFLTSEIISSAVFPGNDQ
jgi:hypothetical protein